MEQSYNVLPDDTQVPAFQPGQPAKKQETVTFNPQGYYPYDPKQRAKEAGVFPQFFHKTILNNFKSKQENRPIYDDVEFVRIVIAGDRNNQPERKVRDADKERWPVEYQAFKRQEQTAVTGTPIEEWSPCSRSMAATMKHFNVFTVEALAELSDTGLQAIGMGARDLQKQAIAYLEYAKDTSLPARMLAENERLSEALAALQNQVKELGAATKDYKEMQQKVNDAENMAESLKMVAHGAEAKMNEALARAGELEQKNLELQKEIENLKKPTAKPAKKTE